MAQFLYYLEKLAGATMDDIRRVGLDYAFDSDDFERMQSSGPDGSRGLLIGNDKQKLGYYPEEQVWVSCNGGKYWMGYYEDQLPRPEDLKRDKVVSGLPVELTDKNEWELPQATVLASCLCALEFRKMAEYWDRVFQAFQYGNGLITEETILSNEEEIEIGVYCLHLNYRVSGYELDVMNILDAESLLTIFLTFIDAPSIVKREAN